MDNAAQADLFGDESTLPEGFRYQAALIGRPEENALVEQLRELPFREFEFQGFLARRRVVSFGRRYDAESRTVREAEPIPPFLLEVRERAAAFAGMPADRLVQLLINEYRPGAAIGWHRDKPVFAEVVGISLLSEATFRLRRRSGDGWQRVSIRAEPRSAYLLSGSSRTEWEHSVPAVAALRYSITFRALAAG